MKYKVEISEVYTYTIEVEATDLDDLDDAIHETKSVMNMDSDDIEKLDDFNTSFTYDVID